MLLSKVLCVLIAGKAGAGKSTSAYYMKDYLQGQHYNLNGTVISFATGVKECAKTYFGWDGKKDERGRLLLQNVGRIGREYNANIWVDDAVNRFYSSSYDGIPLDFMIVDDWRYPNEKERLLTSKLFKVITVRIESPASRLSIPENSFASRDSSETSLPSVTGMSKPGLYTGLDGYTYVINNYDSIQNLRMSICTLLDKTIDTLKFK